MPEVGEVFLDFLDERRFGLDIAIAENNNYCEFVDDYLDSETGSITGQKKLLGSKVFNDELKNPHDVAINFRIHNQVQPT